MAKKKATKKVIKKTPQIEEFEELLKQAFNFDPNEKNDKKMDEKTFQSDDSRNNR